MASEFSHENANMIKLIKGGKIFAPEDIGIQDILIVNGSILKISREISANLGPKLESEIYDAKDKIICPGLIDSHIHLIGGGGAGGWIARTKEMPVERIVRHGVTTVIGCLGMDHVSRSVQTLTIKAKALETSGISAYVFTGSWIFPPATITCSVEEDLLFVDPVIGMKLAIGEAGSTHPTRRDLKDLLGQMRRGSLLSGKAGILHIHLGPRSQDGVRMFQEILSEVKYPFHKVIFTHANQSKEIFNLTVEYLKQGGAIDFTASQIPAEKPGCIRASEAFKTLMDENLPVERVTFTSDSNASRVLKDGKVVYIGIEHLFSEVISLVLEQKISFSSALKPVTTNPAKLYQIDLKKGSLDPGKDADLVILNDRLEIIDVMAKGRWVVKKGEPVIRDPV